MTIPEFNGPYRAAETRAAFGENGAIILRRAIPDAVMEHMRLMCTAVFAIFDMKVQDVARSEIRHDDPLVDYVKRYGVLQFIGEDVVRTLLSHAYLPRSGFDRITEVLLRVLRAAFPYRSFEFIPGKSALRRQGTQGHAQKSAYVEWHRDSHAVQTVEHGDCLNCWVPLSAVGVDRPSLQVVLGSNRVLQDRPVDYQVHDNPSDDQVNKDYDSSMICTAMLDPGDVLLFGHHTLHRTQLMGDDYPVRLSGEFRFTSKAPSSN